MKKHHLAAGLTALLLLALALVSILPARLAGREAAQEGNLVKNGDFSAVSDGMPDGWTQGMWVTTAGASYLEPVTLEDGTTAVLIENAAANDARFEQTVPVRENATYRLSARVRAAGCDPTKTGANVSFLGIYGTSECAYETQGEWTTLTLYARTGKGQHEATVCVRLGGYGSEASGKAWFTGVEMTQTDDVPIGVQVLDISPREEQAKPENSEKGSADFTIPALLLSAAVYLLAAAWIVARLLRPAADGLSAKKPPRAALPVLLAATTLLRVVLALLVEGYGVDMSCFTAWAMRMAETGPIGFYEEGYFCDYPPAYMLLLGVVGAVARLTGASLADPGGQFALKLLPVAYDALLATALYRFAKREAGERPALGVAALVALNPAFILTGSCWGQIDALLALLLVLVLADAREGRWQRAIPLFALAVLAKPQAGLLAPLGVAALVREGIGKERSKRLKAVAIGLGAGMLLTLAVVLPFSFRQDSPAWLLDKYVSTLSGYEYATLSTGNLMFLLGGNWVKIQEAVLGPVTYGQLGTVMMALSFLAGIAVYLRGKGRSRLLLASALTMQGVFCLGSMMHERYIVPALVLLLMAYLETGDARLLVSAVVSGAATAVNVGVVLAYDYLIQPNLWLGYLLAVAQLAAFALTAWAALSLSLGREARRLTAAKPVAAQGKPESAADTLTARRRAELLNERDYRLHMTRRDWAAMLTITAVYAVVGFWGLGATKAPQGGYTSTAAGETIVFDLGERRENFHIYYYGGVSYDGFSIAAADTDEASAYGQSVDAYLVQGDCYKWQAVRQPIYNESGEITGVTGSMLPFSGRYVRLTYADAGVALWEVAFVDGEGNALPVVSARVSGGIEGRMGDPMTLVDEQDTVPEKPSYLNSMYFDEVYHARTGYEHAHNQYIYETTHPPLGKVFMSWCIRLMGMTPFAWRFAGTLTGVLMLPALYLLAKQLFGATRWAALCALLLAADCMHFTQTRIATIDSFPVLFIVVMFFFMLRWTRMSFFHQSLGKTFVPLALSGFFMGLAIASKWIGCYGAVGLAIVFFARMLDLYRQYAYARAHRKEKPAFARAADGFARKALLTLAACVVFFVIVPIVIYCMSYIPYLRAYGPVRLNAATLKRIWDAQVVMFDYHSNLVAEHDFASPWYEWPIIAKPMWYYSTPYAAPGKISTILTFGNPAVWWTGLAGILFVLTYSVRRNALASLGVMSAREDEYDRAMPLIAAGFLSAYLPWVLVSRLTFIYHYFASVPFIILATAQCLRYAERRRPRLTRAAAIVLCVLSVALFIAFYPLASGVEVPVEWFDAVNWFPGWMYR